jgi:hypothetical protein
MTPIFEKIARALCQSGARETGEGTCAFSCMDQLGDVRAKGCPHAGRVHGKAAEKIFDAIKDDFK